MFNLADYPVAVEKINNIVNAGDVAEIKLEKHGTEIAVVQSVRTVRDKETIKGLTEGKS